MGFKNPNITWLLHGLFKPDYLALPCLGVVTLGPLRFGMEQFLFQIDISPVHVSLSVFAVCTHVKNRWALLGFKTETVLVLIHLVPRIHGESNDEQLSRNDLFETGTAADGWHPMDKPANQVHCTAVIQQVFFFFFAI